MSGILSQYLHAFADRFDDRGANENHFHRLGTQHCLAQVYVAGELPSVAIAQDGDIEQRKGFLRGAVNFAREQNCSSAGAEKRAAVCGELLQRVEQAFLRHHLQVCGAFAAGKDYARDAFQIYRTPNVGMRSADAVDHLGVCFVITLDCEDAYGHFCFIERDRTLSGMLTSHGFASNPFLRAGECRGPSWRRQALRKLPAPLWGPCNAWSPSRLRERVAPG